MTDRSSTGAPALGVIVRTAQARLAVDPGAVVAPIDRRLFGGFVEHMGRCVYTGIFEPGHRTATEEGFRGDVLELVRGLGPTMLRYPGGNYVSGYRWEDTVGPAQERPRRLDLAWRAIETNQFGLHEFMSWCGLAGTEPMLALNLGTRGVQSAIDLVEYCNFPGGTALSDQRRANGAEQPFGVQVWCLGNEMDGPWQLGHRPAAAYGQLAAETARALRRIDPELELVVCGSSSSTMPTFGSWESEVLELCYDEIDYISVHAYYEPHDGDYNSFLASGVDMESVIEKVGGIVDQVRRRKGSTRQVRLSFDEWNVWYAQQFPGLDTLTWQSSKELVEDQYTAVDAVVTGSLLISLLKHADRVAIACLAQLVNVIAPIMTEPGGPAWPQASYHVLAETARWAHGVVLRAEVICELHDTARYGQVSDIDATVTWDGDAGAATVLVVNRACDADVDFTVDLSALDRGSFGELTGVVLSGDASVVNTAAEPNRVQPRPAEGISRTGAASWQLRLPAASWALLRCKAGG